MKITVKANDFCPDDCQFCSLTESLLKDANGRFYTAYNCKHEALCKNMYETIKNKFIQFLENSCNL